MKTGVIISALFAVGMAAPVETQVKECEPMYEGNLFISTPRSGHMGLTITPKMNHEYGGKMLEAKKDNKSHMEVVFSRCKNSGHSSGKDFYTGVVSLKGEADKCLMHSGKNSR